MIRRRLSWQLALAMLVASLLPLAGTGLLTLHLLTKTLHEHIRSG